MDRPPPLRPGKVSPKLEVPAHILRPPYADSGMMPDWDPKPQIHDAAGIEKMRAAGRLAAQVRAADAAGTAACLVLRAWLGAPQAPKHSAHLTPTSPPPPPPPPEPPTCRCWRWRVRWPSPG